MRRGSPRRLPILLGLVNLLSCGGPGPRPASSVGQGEDAVLAASARVTDVDNPDRPTLRLIHRDGDPHGAAAVAVFPPGGSRAVVLLAALLESRLRRAGFASPELSMHALGLVLATEVRSTHQGVRFHAAVHQALLAPVVEGDPALRRAATYLAELARTTSDASAVDACLGSLGAEGRPNEEATHAPSARELERLRRETAVASRVGLSMLGSSGLLDAVARRHDRTWPRGPLIEDPWPLTEEVNVLPGSPSLTLRVAIRTADQEAALAAARALRRPDHPVFARLGAVAPGIEALVPQVTLRPLGACLAMSWVMPSADMSREFERVATAALVAREELGRALGDAATEDESTLALLAPEGAVEAAALAAWSAVRAAPREEVPARGVLEIRGGPEWAAKQKAFRQVVATTGSALLERELDFVSRSEGGQAESWLLVASPCGTLAEQADESGLRALTVASLARGLSGKSRVSLEPWITTNAIGLLAHAPPLRGETPDHHAARIARVLGQALAGPPLDGRDVAAVRSEHLALIGRGPGEDLMLRVLAGEVPSFLSPLGLEADLATMSVADVQRMRAALLREPLRAAFIASGTRSQAEAAQAALSAWLAPHRGAQVSCPKPRLSEVEPARYTLQTIDETVAAGGFVGVRATAPRSVGRALEFLLNRPGGYLDRSLLQAGLVASAQARWLGDERVGGLFIELRAEPAQLPLAIDQTRAVLDELARGALSDRDAERARAEQVRVDQGSLKSPRGRVVRLFLGREPEVVSPERLRALTAQLGPSEHRIVQVTTR